MPDGVDSSTTLAVDTPRAYLSTPGQTGIGAAAGPAGVRPAGGPSGSRRC